MSAISSAQIRQRALLAASSVVLALNLPGCFEPVADKAPYDTSAGADTSADTSDTSTGGDTSTGADTSGADTSTGGDTSGGDTASARPDCTTVASEELGDCCLALYEWCQEHFTESTDQYECAYGDSGCIPWGPPAPPRLRAVA